MYHYITGKIAPAGGVTPAFLEQVAELLGLVNQFPNLLTIDSRHDEVTLAARLGWRNEAAMADDFQGNSTLLADVIERILGMGGELILDVDAGEALFDSLPTNGPSWYRTMTVFVLYEPEAGVDDDWRAAYAGEHFPLLQGTQVNLCETKYSDGQFMARLAVSLQEPTESNKAAQGKAREDAHTRGFSRYPDATEGPEMWDSLPNVGDTWVRDGNSTTEA